MMRRFVLRLARNLALTVALCASTLGCASTNSNGFVGSYGVPVELDKQPLPDYVIEPPDILQIDAVRLVPKGPYKIEALDTIVLHATNVLTDAPLEGAFQVDVDGTIDLGAVYDGKVKVVDLTPEEARTAVEKHLLKKLDKAKVVLNVIPSRSIQQIRGQHLVRPDGTVGLGTYGSVRVVGLTIQGAKDQVEKHLSKHFTRPEVSVDIVAFNSKLFYVILDGAGNGEQVFRFPVTGNETVLDAIAAVNGLLPVSNKREIFVARPSPRDEAGDQILCVDWVGVATRAHTATNYQLHPGDRVYINSEPIIEFDTRLARFLSPIERVLGVTLLGHATVRTLKRADPIGNTVGSGGIGSGF